MVVSLMLVFVLSLGVAYAAGKANPNPVADAAKAFVSGGSSPYGISVNYSKGQSFAPVKSLLAELGVSTTWDQATSILTAMNGDQVVQVKIGEKKGNIVPISVGDYTYNIKFNSNTLKL